MRFSYKWLKELVDFKINAIELADLINLHITEVESQEKISANYSGVIVAEILAIAPHPHADKLKLPTLDIGLGKRVQVICGASNIAVGQKVPLALVGAMLPVGKIEPVTIRGVESSGMICSGAELGLEAKSDGILVLPKTASVGRPVNEILSISDDTILNLKILSNRPDYLSYIGIAREIAAVLGSNWPISLSLAFSEQSQLDSHQKIKVIVKDSDLCPYYSARWVGNIEVKESPDWLKDKLISAGIRPINNLVDVSNLVMLEIGQPIHIFDYAKIEGQEIIIRRAKPEEKIIALTGATIELNQAILTIANSQIPMAIAGIVGGEFSRVSDLTTEIIVESAVFQPAIIRKGTKNLGIATDASLRFERGSSPYLAKLAMDRAMALIQMIQPTANIAAGEVVVSIPETKPKTLVISEKEISELLGYKITKSQIIKILNHLEFAVSQTGSELKIVPPPFRLDIKEMADIAEEIIRMIGIDKIKPQLPCVVMQAPAVNLKYLISQTIKDYLVQNGLNETPSHNFIGEAWATALNLKLNPDLRLLNPLNSNWTHLNSHLWPNLLQFVQQFKLNQFALFEINPVFHSIDAGILPTENLSLAIVVNSGLATYRRVRGLIEQIIGLMESVKLLPVPTNADEPYINILRIIAGKEIVGSIEEISPVLANKLDVPLGTVIAELNLDWLISQTNYLQTKFQPFSHYPASTFDLSLELSSEVSAGHIIAEIYQLSPLIKNVDVFDVYKLADGKNSVGFRIILQADDRTLKEAEIKTLESKTTNLIVTKYRGKIR